jgi:hypothetical protein
MADRKVIDRMVIIAPIRPLGDFCIQKKISKWIPKTIVTSPVIINPILNTGAAGFNPGTPFIPPSIAGCPKSLRALVAQINHGDKIIAKPILRNPMEGPRTPQIAPNCGDNKKSNILFI